MNMNLVYSKDSDNKVICETLLVLSLARPTNELTIVKELEDEIVSDDLDSQCIVEDKIRDALANILNF